MGRSWELGAGSWEPGAGSREPGAGSRESGGSGLAGGLLIDLDRRGFAITGHLQKDGPTCDQDEECNDDPDPGTVAEKIDHRRNCGEELIGVNPCANFILFLNECTRFFGD